MACKRSTVVIADAKTKVYGDADPSLTFQVSGLKNGDSAGAVLNGGSLSRVAGENVGVYGINQGDLALNSGNYDLSYHVQHGADGGQPEVRVDQADAVHLRATEDFRDQVVERADGDHRHPAEGAGVHVADGPVGVVGEGVDGLDRP